MCIDAPTIWLVLDASSARIGQLVGTDQDDLLGLAKRLYGSHAASVQDTGEKRKKCNCCGGSKP